MAASSMTEAARGLEHVRVKFLVDGLVAKPANFQKRIVFLSLRLTAQECGGVYQDGTGFVFPSKESLSAFLALREWSAELADAEKVKKAEAKRQAKLEAASQQTARLERKGRYVKAANFLQYPAWKRLDFAAQELGGKHIKGKGWQFPKVAVAEQFVSKHQYQG